jgi:hypothetical protein
VGTLRSTPQTARVSPNDFARPDASIARGELESNGVLLVELGGAAVLLGTTAVPR